MPSRKNCCIHGCNNTSRRERGFGVEVKFYKFPESVFGASWKILKRKQWINAVKNYVENPKDWVPNKYTRICSTHFVNNEKSEHPLHPSYVPSIFPGRENVKRNMQSLERFQRVGSRETKKIQINKYIESEKKRNNINIENTIDTEQGNEEHASSVEEHPINIHVETAMVKPVQQSIPFQTKLVTDGAYEDLAHFFCNPNYSNDLNMAAAQTNMEVKQEPGDPFIEEYKIDTEEHSIPCQIMTECGNYEKDSIKLRDIVKNEFVSIKQENEIDRRIDNLEETCIEDNADEEIKDAKSDSTKNKENSDSSSSNGEEWVRSGDSKKREIMSKDF